MTAPVLWGLDPDAVYLFTPSEFLDLPEGFNEAFEAQAQAMPGATVEDIARATWDKFRDAPRTRQEGAPLFHLAPLSEKNALRLQSARESFRTIKRDAEARLKADIVRIKALDIPEDEKAERIDAAQAKRQADACTQSDAVYSPDLQFTVLQDCVKGWQNIRKPFTGKWSVDGPVLKGAWKSEIFWSIVTESAFKEEAIQGFTSPPASPAG